MKIALLFTLTFLISGLKCDAEALTEKEVVTLLQSGFTAEEIAAEVRKKGYVGTRDSATMKRLREAGANADIVILLSQAGQPPMQDTAVVAGEDWEPFKDKNGKYGFKNNAGAIVIPPKWDAAGSFQVPEQRAFVKMGEKYGFIDANGELVIPLKWRIAGTFSNGLAVVRSRKHEELEIDDPLFVGPLYTGLIDKSGNVVIPDKWHLLTYVPQKDAVLVRYLETGDDIFCRNFTTEGMVLLRRLAKANSGTSESRFSAKPIDQLLKDPETAAELEKAKNVKDGDWDQLMQELAAIVIYTYSDSSEAELEEIARRAKKHHIEIFSDRADYRITGPGRLELKK
jgi:hypothetical protein